MPIAYFSYFARAPACMLSHVRERAGLVARALWHAWTDIYAWYRGDGVACTKIAAPLLRCVPPRSHLVAAHLYDAVRTCRRTSEYKATRGAREMGERRD